MECPFGIMVTRLALMAHELVSFSKTALSNCSLIMTDNPFSAETAHYKKKNTIIILITISFFINDGYIDLNKIIDLCCQVQKGRKLRDRFYFPFFKRAEEKSGKEKINFRHRLLINCLLHHRPRHDPPSSGLDNKEKG